mgnify:CR=1 FL=1
MEPTTVLLASVALAAGVLITVTVTSILGKRKILSAEKAAQEIVEAARHQARAIQKDGENKAREQALSTKASLDEQEKKQTRELNHQRRELEKRTDAVTRQEQAVKEQRETVRRKEEKVQERETTASAQEEELARASDEHRRKLEEIASLTAEQAKERLMEEMTEAARE